MSRTLQKNGILRNRWDQYSRQYKDSMREVAKRAGIDPSTLSRAINAGVASEPIREALQKARVPAHLIPLPSCPSHLAGIILAAQEQSVSPKI
jgi:negative regulator of sigma E activity